MKSLRIRNGIFSGFPEGVTTAHKDSITVVILSASAISRSYSTPDSGRPLCWSVDTATPSMDIPEEDRQATRCMDCPKNIRAGPNSGKPCKFFKRLAVVFDDNLTDVYQLQIQANSIFGKKKSAHGYGLQAYTKLLLENETASATLCTHIKFDPETEMPKLLFSPVRPLEENEITVVKKIMDSKKILEAIDTNTHTGITAKESPFNVEVGGYTITDS